MPDMTYDPSESAVFEHLRGIARQLDESDYERDDPPIELWARIAAQTAPPVDLNSRRRRRATWVIGAAAAIVAVLGIALVPRDRDEGQLLAKTDLTNEGLGARGAQTSGEATLRRLKGNLVLRVNVNDAPGTSASYLELWMIDKKVQGMVSLGPFRGSADYPVPNGVDPDNFPVVDVSIEPGDGVPTHSGESVVRGVLE